MTYVHIDKYLQNAIHSISVWVDKKTKQQKQTIMMHMAQVNLFSMSDIFIHSFIYLFCKRLNIFLQTDEKDL